MLSRVTNRIRYNLVGSKGVRSFSTDFSSVPNAVQDALDGLKGRHLTRIDDYSSEELRAVLHYAGHIKHAHKQATLGNPLDKESVAMIFQKRSTRTRVSTETGMQLLGGFSLFLSSDDVQLGVNETIKDSALVLSRFNSLILARVFGHEIITELCEHSTVPVINALSDMHHPLQTLADYLTMYEMFGSDLSGRKVSWVGDGNNVLHDLMLAAPMLGVNVSIATPKGYEPNPQVTVDTQKLCEEHGTTLELCNDPATAIQGGHGIFTDTWVSMGEEEQAKKKLADFSGYKLTMELVTNSNPASDWKFLHCLPRHPEEVADDVFYSDHSVVFDEAENRMYTVMAVMATMLGKAKPLL